MRYIPNSAEERAKMLAEMGVQSIEDFFTSIPAHLRLEKPLNLPPAYAESELIKFFKKLAARNTDPNNTISFLGAGAYNHFRPIVIDTLISRSEFYTTYTPYQPEIAQGTLQAIFEFQSMICLLTGMEVANASMYDGSTAMAEAALMANRITRRKKILVSQAVHPEYRAVLDTYLKSTGLVSETVAFSASGQTALDSINLDSEVAAVIVQSPNFFGCIEDMAAVAEKAHQAGALFISVTTEPISWGLLRSPGDCGADIVVAEGQSFGIAPSYGGPYLGIFASRAQYQRQMPGRLIGEAFDADGNRGFVITLATREQHIRREKASSNICTNQGLFMLMATVYLATMGKQGLQEVAKQNLQKSAYAAKAISELDGYSLLFSAPRFNEFVVKTPKPATEIMEKLLSQNIIAGLPLSNYYPDMTHALLVCVTEQNTKADIDQLVAALK
ncbi:MAG: aminomethyl-transferring glycine dehydrogenase subunit GcvPA [Blastocatellia bacterium]|nr:aminomethyl-transferring glycine dehydrogenase subunit GcvPA [Blastocatellia bacterium]MBN8725972.1 aminomethyl-transferring glycine dehydrogenase subunit GcvPA [Acidobacteriota bacterium]